MMVFAGVLYQRSAVPAYLTWMHDISIINFGFMALIGSQAHILPPVVRDADPKNHHYVDAASIHHTELYRHICRHWRDPRAVLLTNCVLVECDSPSHRSATAQAHVFAISQARICACACVCPIFVSAGGEAGAEVLRGGPGERRQQLLSPLPHGCGLPDARVLERQAPPHVHQDTQVKGGGGRRVRGVCDSTAGKRCDS